MGCRINVHYSSQQQEHSPGCVCCWLFEQCSRVWSSGPRICGACHARGLLGLCQQTALGMSFPWTSQTKELESYSLEAAVEAQGGNSAHCHLPKARWDGDSHTCNQAVSTVLLRWGVFQHIQWPEQNGRWSEEQENCRRNHVLLWTGQWKSLLVGLQEGKGREPHQWACRLQWKASPSNTWWDIYFLDLHQVLPSRECHLKLFSWTIKSKPALEATHISMMVWPRLHYLHAPITRGTLPQLRDCRGPQQDMKSWRASEWVTVLSGSFAGCPILPGSWPEKRYPGDIVMDLPLPQGSSKALLCG